MIVLSHKENSDSSNFSDISDSDDDTKDIDQLATMFANQDINKDNVGINPIYTKRFVDKYYYQRPSPQDLLYEENDFYQNSYSGRSIYEWNIDGLNEKQIVDVTQKMLMYSTICKQKGNSDSVIVAFITTGFVGQLRGWWDFYLNDSQRKEILSHKKLVKIESSTSSSPINSTSEEDAVYTLCLSILQNFVGTSIPVGERITTLL
jgi:hypothetical protein